MTRMLLRRLGLAIPTLLGVSVVIFLLMSVLPGDPLAGLLAQDATAADRAALTHSLGLDAPLAVRYVRWLRDVLHGDFGYSPYRKRDVSELLGTAFVNTVQLAVAAATLGIGTGLTLGVLAAVMRGRVIDRLVSMLAMTGISIPSYWVAILLIIIFSATLKWLPAGGMHSVHGSGFLDYVKHVAMPAFASAFVSIGVTARMTRASPSRRTAWTSWTCYARRAARLAGAGARCQDGSIAGAHGRRPPGRLPARRLRARGDDLLVAGPGAVDLPGDRGPRLPGAQPACWSWP